MKKIMVFLLVALFGLAVSNCYAGSILFEDDFESYPLDFSGFGNPNVSWWGWGQDAGTGSGCELYITPETGNKFARLAWYGYETETVAGTTIGAALRYDDPPGPSSYDLSGMLSISFRLRSNLASALQVLSPYFVDSSDNIVRLSDSALLYTPEDGDGWVEYNINYSDMTFGAGTIDLTDIVEVNIGFFQAMGASDMIGEGAFDLDDLSVAVPEPLSILLLGSAVLGLFRFRKKD